MKNILWMRFTKNMRINSAFWMLISIMILSIVTMGSATASQGSIKLLAVQQDEFGIKGSIADLHLEIKSGSGRVFVDTFPLTKIDTQVSTRFGKEIACNYLEIDCDRYDFFYTIRANSPIIAGPSAGAAITTLTISLLGRIPISTDVAITGTINSGGIIGPVGGVKEKIEAAAENGIKKVLIPYGERYHQPDSFGFVSTEETITDSDDDVNQDGEEGEEESRDDDIETDQIPIRNITSRDIPKADERLDLVEYGRVLGIEVIEVSDINDAIFEFSGVMLKDYDEEIAIDESYQKTMATLAHELCRRGEMLTEHISRSGMILNQSYVLHEEGINLTQRATDAMSSDLHYSAASYCYGANVKFGTVILLERNESSETLLQRMTQIEQELDSFSVPKYKTITDLQASMIVDERINDARNTISTARRDVAQGDNVAAIYNLAYAIERKFSAYAWSMFITGEGREFGLTEQRMKISCEKKISEAEERYQYAALFFPGLLDNLRIGINSAYDELALGRYESCLFRAAKAKAETDVLLNVVGVEVEDVADLVGRKLDIAEKFIIRQTQQGVFPIVGFSYYEYARELKDTDVFSALLYTEYALEMSSLDLYFKESRKIIITEKDKDEIAIFLIGLGAGLLIGVMVMLNAKRSGKKATKKQKG